MAVAEFETRFLIEDLKICNSDGVEVCDGPRIVVWLTSDGDIDDNYPPVLDRYVVLPDYLDGYTVERMFGTDSYGDDASWNDPKFKDDLDRYMKGPLGVCLENEFYEQWAESHE